MAHDQRTLTAPASGGRDWRKLAPSLALAVVLTGASAVSLIHLAGAWEAGAPYRATREALAEKARADREAERVAAAAREAAADEAWRAANAAGWTDRELWETQRSLPIATGAGANVTDLAPVVGARPNARPTNRTVDTGPVRWASEPRFDIPRAILMKPGPERIAIEFECRVNTSGGLYSCRGIETPRGFGMLPSAHAALRDARVEPLTDNGRVVEGSITFGYNWTRPLSVAAPPAPPPVIEPVEAEAVPPAPPALEPPAADPAAEAPAA